MAAEIESEYDANINLIKESGGIFDVFIDGNLVFSKHELDRFPVDGEVTDIIKAREAQAN